MKKKNKNLKPDVREIRVLGEIWKEKKAENGEWKIVGSEKTKKEITFIKKLKGVFIKQ